MLAQQAFDLIITDYQMPEVTGDGPVRRSKTSKPGQKVIILTCDSAEMVGWCAFPGSRQAIFEGKPSLWRNNTYRCRR